MIVDPRTQHPSLLCAPLLTATERDVDGLHLKLLVWVRWANRFQNQAIAVRPRKLRNQAKVGKAEQALRQGIIGITQKLQLQLQIGNCSLIDGVVQGFGGLIK